jgi:hypothetical protein
VQIRLTDDGKATASPHSRLWQLTLLFLVVLPFLPEIVIYAVSALAKTNGCQIEAKSPCVVAGTSVSAIIVAGLDASLLRGAGFAEGISAVWLALCYVVINWGWSRALSRLLLALAVTIIFAFLPYLAPMLAIMNLVNPYCHPNAGGVGPCWIFGENVGSAAHETVSARWFMFIGAPIALGVFCVYVIVTVVIRIISARRAVRPAE